MFSVKMTWRGRRSVESRLRRLGVDFPRFVRVAFIAVLYPVIEMQIGRGAEAFVVEARQTERFL
jgi:hypothetical protein